MFGAMLAFTQACSRGVSMAPRLERTEMSLENAMSRQLIILALCIIGRIVLAAPAKAAEGPLMAGVATVDITPEPGLMLWGYSNRTHGATGKLDPLMAKAVVLKAGDQSVA